VWQLPDDLIPLALSLYQLQRSPLLDPAALEPDPSDWTLQQQQQQLIDGVTFINKSSSSSSGQGSMMYGSWRLLVQQFIQTSPSAALRMVAPWLYVYDASSGQFEVLPPLNLALEPDALAVLDCGNELLIYVGEVLEALVEGIAPAKDAAAAAAAGIAAASGGSVEPQQQQQQGKEAASAIESAADAAAAAAVNGRSSAGGRPPVRDMAVAAAPAVSCAHQLLRGRVPVPAIRLIEDEAGMASLMQRLVPLHEDPVALQLLLLPHLRDLSPAQHGYLLDWHKHWAAAGAAAAQQQQGGGAGDGRVAGGARMVRGEGVSSQLSFGQWYSSFGVVLRSPGGILEGSPAVE
jgi:hypothetical protein